MDYKINSAEFALLLLISEMPRVNGYRLRQTVADRGIENWAGVSSSSIYVVLKKLEKCGFIDVEDDLEKETKGPRGKVYSLTVSGGSTMKHATEQSLSETREHDPRFKIALSGMDFLGASKTIMCLNKRCTFLEFELARLTDVEAKQPELPLSAQLIFDQTKHSIGAEIAWLKVAVSKIQNGEL